MLLLVLPIISWLSIIIWLQHNMTLNTIYVQSSWDFIRRPFPGFPFVLLVTQSFLVKCQNCPTFLSLLFISSWVLLCCKMILRMKYSYLHRWITVVIHLEYDNSRNVALLKKLKSKYIFSEYMLIVENSYLWAPATLKPNLVANAITMFFVIHRNWSN